LRLRLGIARLLRIAALAVGGVLRVAGLAIFRVRRLAVLRVGWLRILHVALGVLGVVLRFGLVLIALGVLRFSLGAVFLLVRFGAHLPGDALRRLGNLVLLLGIGLVLDLAAIDRGLNKLLLADLLFDGLDHRLDALRLFFLGEQLAVGEQHVEHFVQDLD